MSQKYVPTVPSSLLDLNREDSAVDAFVKNFSDYSLKIGLILRVYDIDHKLNVNKKQVEYDVLSFIQDKDLASSPAIYPRCIMADSFGGVGDFFEFKKREPSKDILKDSSFDLKDGSMVLLLSSNGNAESGVIIGAIQHTNRKTTLTKEAGHHLEGEFNGINWQVNKDGELTITYKSKTDNKGKAQDEEAG